MLINSDFLIIGAGVVGLTLARELKLRFPLQSVMVLEKESKPGLHSSGRNSGVLHSGIYYPPDSLKAKVCRLGAQEMAEYHEQNQLPLRRCGKILVVTRPDDGHQLNTLAERALKNGVQAEMIDEHQLREMEPEVRSAVNNALWVPSTSVGSPLAMMQTLLSQIVALGVKVECQSKIVDVDLKSKSIQLANGNSISYGHAINAAGLHADRIAHLFDVGQRYTLLPFKGIYWKLSSTAGINVRRLIYPVPDLRVPFLGVHTTTTTDGVTYLGPTAVPAFSRENYRGLEGVEFSDLTRISQLLVKQYISGQDGFRRLAWQEGRRYFKRWFTQAAQAILPRLRMEHLLPAEKVGIRAQMLDKKTGRLVTDFLIERGPSSTHVLNAISPAWTSSFPFARYVCDHYIERSS